MGRSRRERLEAGDPLGPPTFQEIGSAVAKPTQIIEGANSFAFKQFRLTNIGLEIHGPISKGDWKAAGDFLRRAGASLQWWIGDWMNAAPGEWGDMYGEAMQITGYTKETLANLAYICNRVKLSLRNDNLKFMVHAVVAPLGKEDQIKYLNIAAAAEPPLSAAKLRILIEREKHKDEIPPEKMPVANKVHRKIVRRMWKALDTGNIALLSHEDLQSLHDLLVEVDNALSIYEAKKAAETDDSTD